MYYAMYKSCGYWYATPWFDSMEKVTRFLRRLPTKVKRIEYHMEATRKI